jgi:hypothetical protein
MKLKLTSVALAAGMVCLLGGRVAVAQQQAQAQGQVGMGLPQAAPQADAVQGESDHDAMIGRVAVGFLGRRSMFIGNNPDPAGLPAGVGQLDPNDTRDEVNAPVVGIRYWIDQMIGLDFGLGFSINGGSQEFQPPEPPAANSADKAGITAFIIHAGVPLSLDSSQHFSFQIVPELNVGFASATVSPGGGADDTEFRGFHIDIGARAGAEIHFGFIDIPRLSLQGSVGVRYAMDTTSATVKSQPELSFEDTSWAFGTTVGDNPWNIFTTNVAALYYF